MIGYMQVYFKVMVDNEEYYVSYNSGFTKTVTRLGMSRIKKLVKLIMREKYGDVSSIKFITKEEFEENKNNPEEAEKAETLYWSKKEGFTGE